MAGLRPSVELSYRVPLARGLALAAAGQQEEADRHLGMAFDQLMALLSDLSSADRETALSAVSAHREVMQAWALRRPHQAQHRLARVGAPSGRPLGPDEWVTVTWTLHTPGDADISNPLERRRHQILRLLAEASAQGGAPTVEDLAAALKTSVATARRDLAALRRSGRAAATRGARSAS